MKSERLKTIQRLLQDQDQWATPPNYFRSAEREVYDRLYKLQSLMEEPFIEQQRDIKFNRPSSPEWKVPSGYFDQLPLSIERRRAKMSHSVYRKVWVSLAAAAAVAGVIFLSYPHPSNPQDDVITAESLEGLDANFFLSSLSSKELNELYEEEWLYSEMVDDTWDIDFTSVNWPASLVLLNTDTISDNTRFNDLLEQVDQEEVLEYLMDDDYELLYE